MRLLLLLAITFAACAPAPVLNPDKDRAKLRDNKVKREVQLDEAPGGVVLTRDGATVELSTLWEKQPVVVVFYRGHWCPHCQYQFGELQKHREGFTARGANLIGISSDEPSDLGVMRQKLGLTFELYSDQQLAVIGKWGVEDYGNGIAKPATFIVQRGGAITFQTIGEKPQDRPSTQQILDALQPAG